MSLILEALRKSEAERRRGLAPDVTMELPPAPASRPRAIRTWLPAAMVVIVFVVFAVWWTRREPANATSTMTTVAGDETPQLMPQSTPPISQVVPRIEAKPALAASVPTPTPAPAETSPETPAGDLTRATAATPTPMPSQPAQIQSPPPPLPTPSRDISSDTSLLPPVKLSMLMWDDVPSKRFVILNGQRMAEGERYGVITVIAIERSGVVVEGNGTKARVPLP